jgi:hypothetical protein
MMLTLCRRSGAAVHEITVRAALLMLASRYSRGPGTIRAAAAVWRCGRRRYGGIFGALPALMNFWRYPTATRNGHVPVEGDVKDRKRPNTSGHTVRRPIPFAGILANEPQGVVVVASISS